ncbi:glycosyltransferase family 2 protein [bacterium]|nr:glycosyltransferase family 2 protein [bacterium]
MSAKPGISVLMGVHNSIHHLAEAIDSILGQQYDDFEFIIIDDGSTDGSADVIDKYGKVDNRIRIFHQENKGLAVTLNRGLEAAAGKYIARMDGDDISMPQRLKTQLDFMEAHPDVGICGTACRLFGYTNSISWTPITSEEIKSKLIFWPSIVHPSVMMRRDLIEREGLYYDPDFKQAEDYELWSRFSRCCEMANIPEILLHYRTYPTQATFAFQGDVERWSGFVHKRLLRDMGIDPTDDEMELHLALHRSCFKTSRSYLEQIEQWLCKLVGANRHSSLRESNTFELMIFERWCAACALEWKLGLWAWRKLKKSSLYSAAYATSTLKLAWQLARIPLARALQSSALGRCIKRVVRSL